MLPLPAAIGRAQKPQAAVADLVNRKRRSCPGNISEFPGSAVPQVLEQVEELYGPEPGPGEVRIKVLAAGTGFTDSFIRRGPLPRFQGAAAVHSRLRDRRDRREDRLWRHLAARGRVRRRSLRRRRLRPIRDSSRRLARSRPGRRRPRRGGLHSARLSHRLQMQLTSASGAAGGDPGRRGFGHGRHGAARPRAEFRPRGDGNLLGREPPPRSSASARRRSTIAPAISSRPYAALPQVGRAAPASTPPSTRSAAPISVRSFACLAPGGLLVGYGSQTMAVGGEGLLSAGLGLLG